MINNYLEYICCPKCKTDLSQQGSLLLCAVCSAKYPIKDGILVFNPDTAPDTALSVEKWDDRYRRQLETLSFYKDAEDYHRIHFPGNYAQLSKARNIDKDIVYLEIGCGPFYFGKDLAERVKMVIGIDFCPSALKIAKKMLDEKGVRNYLLIQGDILNLPLKNKSIDLIYGGGVIEHFKDTQKCVNELFRVLRCGGVSFNTVPYLNIGSLYRQRYGNIPNVPIIKQISEFIHITLLQGKHMVFGYEMSFSKATLKKVHKKAGFGEVVIDKFDVDLDFQSIPVRLKNIFTWLANNSRMFWPMVKVVAKKSL
jgi:ubiquinone/menaquinone biosynthesis C-methylase UbiE/uncharacterized protein YbaR (Trm112 family)